MPYKTRENIQAMLIGLQRVTSSCLHCWPLVCFIFQKLSVCIKNDYKLLQIITDTKEETQTAPSSF